MFSIALNIFVVFCLYFFAKFFAATVIALTIKRNQKYEDFVGGLKQHVYAILIVSTVSYILFSESALYGLWFLGFVLFTFASLDFEETKKTYKETRESIINTYFS